LIIVGRIRIKVRLLSNALTVLVIHTPSRNKRKRRKRRRGRRKCRRRRRRSSMGGIGNNARGRGALL
jgi:hypothetical protein